MKFVKKIIAFLLATVLLTGVLNVDAHAIPAGAMYCTDVYRARNPETTYAAGYKSNELNIDDDLLIISNWGGFENTYTCVHYMVNGVEVAYRRVNPGCMITNLYTSLYGTSGLEYIDQELFESTPHTGWLFLRDNADADFTTTDYNLYIYWGEPPTSDVTSDRGAHEHHFEYRTIFEPTLYSDGLAGDVCTICGFAKNTQPLSAYGFAINDYATKMVNASKSGQVIKLELGEWNSFPKAFMEKVAAKSAQNVTFVFKYKWNHVKQEITIPAGTLVDTSLDWYGPAKMAELYGAN